MTFSIHGLAVSRGIAIGRAVLVASSRADVAHYFVDAAKVEAEIGRVRASRNAVAEEITRLQRDLPADAPHELAALGLATSQARPELCVGRGFRALRVHKHAVVLA